MERRPLLLNTLLILSILLVANLLIAELDLRFDTTRSDRYSLSAASAQTLATLTDTIRVRLFFSDALPPPNDTISRYAENLMRAYQRESDRFSFSSVDVSTNEGREEARRLGVEPVQLQRIAGERQVQQQAYLGLVVEYGGLVETVSPLRGEQGMEYRVTAAISRLERQRSAYAGLTEPLSVTLYASRSLEELELSNLPAAEQVIRGVLSRLGETTGLDYGYQKVEPASEGELDALRDRYALPRVGWINDRGEQRLGILGLVVEDGRGFEAVPVRIVRGEAGYLVAGIDQLPALIQRSVNSLLGVLPAVGYSVGHNESDITDTEQGAGLFRAILSERYRFVPQNLEAREVDPEIEVLVINGPTGTFTPEALDNIDRFLDRGGSLMLFLDPQTIPPDADPESRDPWVRNGVELRERLRGRGVIITDEIVLDEQNYVGMRADERRPLFQAPRLTGESLNRRSPITRELENVILFNAARLEVSAEHEDLSTVLLRSSPVSWASDALNRIGPWIDQVPPTAPLDSHPLALRVRQPAGGSILVIGTSAITSPALLAAQDKLANRVFLQNAMDTLYGAPGFALLRSKGLSEPRLPAYPGSTRFLVRLVNTAGPPILLLLAGLALLLRRRIRQRKLIQRYTGEGS